MVVFDFFKRYRRGVIAVVGLAVLLAANIGLRHYLENAPNKLFSFLGYYYKNQIPLIFDGPTWKLFLPIEELGGVWCTTSHVLFYYIENALTTAGGFYAVSAILILTAFVVSFSAFRSLVFSFTLAICLGFGTWNYHMYAVTGSISLYLFNSYLLVNLLSFQKLIVSDSNRAAWKALFIASLVTLAMCYEEWLDYMVSVIWLGGAYLFVIFRHHGMKEKANRLVFPVVMATLICGIYLKIRLASNTSSAPGAESEVITNYLVHLNFWPVIEDFIANVTQRVFLAATAFLPPPFMLVSNSLYQFGADALVAEQHGYHGKFAEIYVPMHHVFLWRYYAGMAFMAVMYFLFKYAIKSYREYSSTSVYITLFFIMIATGHATHDIIKFRPMNTTPYLTYHALVGVLGVSALISYLLMLAVKKLENRYFSAGIVLSTWAVIFYGVLTRPRYLTHLAGQIQMGTYPDPLGNLHTYIKMARVWAGL